jgi:hypothetical protein
MKAIELLWFRDGGSLQRRCFLPSWCADINAVRILDIRHIDL